MTFGMTVYDDSKDTKRTINMLTYALGVWLIGTSLMIGTGLINKEGLYEILKVQRNEQIQEEYIPQNDLEKSLYEIDR